MKYLKVLLHPVTQFNLLVVGFLILVQGLHTHAHYTMSVDTDSYVHNYCKKNLEKCKRLVSNLEY